VQTYNLCRLDYCSYLSESCESEGRGVKKDSFTSQNIWGVSSLELHVEKKEGWRTAPGRIISKLPPASGLRNNVNEHPNQELRRAASQA
jgi:hypothetical protein